VADYIQRWFVCSDSETVTLPTINRARRRVTSLIATNVLPLNQATNQTNMIVSTLSMIELDWVPIDPN